MAGPIQHRDDNGGRWRSDISTLHDWAEWVNPLDWQDGLDDNPDDEQIVIADRDAIRSSDAVFVRYEQCSTWGTPREQEYAVRTGTPIYVFLAVDDDETPSPWATDGARFASRDIETVLDVMKGQLL